MALTDKLTAIADAIRAKTGTSAVMTLDEMPPAIEGIETGGDLTEISVALQAKIGATEELTSTEIALEIEKIRSEIPDYVVAEALAVAEAVKSVQTGQTFTFASFADAHIAMHGISASAQNTRASLKMAGQGIDFLRNILPIDAAVVLGDMTASDGAYTVEQVTNDWINSRRGLIAGLSGLTSAWTAGNHEINYGIGRERSMTESEIYAYIGANSNGLTRDIAHPEKCYGYIDFSAPKIRMIVLNTADTLTEKAQSDTAVKADSEFVSAVQLQWLADVALDFSDKTDAAEWGIIFCSHHPLSYGGVNKIGRAMQIAEAYRDGTKGTIAYTSDSTHTVSYDFTSGERAEIICNFCGHSHNYGYGYMRYSTETDPWLLRICTPCINVGRENEHATNESLKGLGEFAEDGVTPIYWRKTVGTREGTSFCINTIDRANKLIYSHAFGVGPDRIISYAEQAITTYTVTSRLTNCMLGNSASVITEGSAYTSTVTANSGYTLDSVTVTMGGIDITATAYADGKLTIAEVTADIVITATAVEEAPAYTNQLDSAGYKYGYRLSSSGAESGASGSYVTGFIPCKYGDRIYLKNVTLQSGVESGLTSSNQRLCVYDANQTFLGVANANDLVSYEAFDTVADENGVITEFSLNGSSHTNAAFFRLNASYIGTDSIITVNEEIV